MRRPEGVGSDAGLSCGGCGFAENADVVGAMRVSRAGLARLTCAVSGVVKPPSRKPSKSVLQGVLSCS